MKFIEKKRTPKDFRNHQNLIELFKNLRDGKVNLRGVLKNQNNSKSDLGEIGNRILDSKSSKCNIKCRQLF